MAPRGVGITRETLLRPSIWHGDSIHFSAKTCFLSLLPLRRVNSPNRQDPGDVTNSPYEGSSAGRRPSRCYVLFRQLVSSYRRGDSGIAIALLLRSVLPAFAMNGSNKRLAFSNHRLTTASSTYVEAAGDPLAQMLLLSTRRWNLRRILQGRQNGQMGSVRTRLSV